MVVDTSALLAALFGETDSDDYLRAISSAELRLISTVSVLEATMVTLARKGPAGVRELDLFIHRGELAVVPFTETQLRLAREAHQRYGKGRHTAALNLGDCCSYALAREAGEPLLYKGDDFSATDVPRAVAGSSGDEVHEGRADR